MRRVWPDTVLGQMIAIVLVAAAMVLFVGAFAEDGYERITAHGVEHDEYMRHVAFLSVALQNQSPSDLEQSLQALSDAGIEGRIHPAGYVAETYRISDPDPADWSGATRCCPQLPAPEAVAWVDGQPMLIFPLADGRTLAFPEGPSQVNASAQYLYLPLAITILVFGFSLFALWGVSYPIRRMAASIEDTDHFLSTEDAVPETGPQELRLLARTLNQMRDRIRNLLESRTTMLRGISHDLRTPLTRLRLRVERMDDALAREQALSDIAQIDWMIGDTLRYLCDSTGQIERETCDLSSLLQSICDDFSDTGGQIRFEGADHLEIDCSVNELTRTLVNLCENGLKFGTDVVVSLRDQDGKAIVEVADNGPGIPVAMRDKVLEPFAKLDAGRPSQEGYGLGLAISAEIIARHRGSLALLDNHPKGLRVRVTLPRRAPSSP